MNMAKIPLSKEEFNLIRGFIEENCGISLGDNKEYQFFVSDPDASMTLGIPSDP
jgi:hypothetical protein